MLLRRLTCWFFGHVWDTREVLDRGTKGRYYRRPIAECQCCERLVWNDLARCGE